MRSAAAARASPGESQGSLDVRIAIDAYELSGRQTGVGRYLTNLLVAWGSLPEAASHEFVLCARDAIRWQVGHLKSSVQVGSGNGTRWQQIVLPGMLRDVKPDVLFAPAYQSPLLTRLPTVLSIHDVSFLAHPEWFAWRERLRRRVLTKLSAQRAARVLTFSEFTKHEIVRYLKVEPERIEVTYHGITRLSSNPPSPDGFGAAGSQPSRDGFGGADADLVLYVGSVFNRRHVPELIEGFSRLAIRRPTARLEIVGDNRSSPHQDLDACAARAPAGRVQVRAFVPDAQLALLYARARVLAFLSDYEGFGMTPLEALAAGIPILVLDTTVAREIYGPAACYIERPDPPLIEAALDRLLFDESERRRILAAAPSVLSRYSWDTCAQRTLQALVSAAR
jgi:glycosyltransferase involved in cell wall biosynthesis